jgi:hypothetical protein
VAGGQESPDCALIKALRQCISAFQAINGCEGAIWLPLHLSRFPPKNALKRFFQAFFHQNQGFATGRF